MFMCFYLFFSPFSFTRALDIDGPCPPCQPWRVGRSPRVIAFNSVLWESTPEAPIAEIGRALYTVSFPKAGYLRRDGKHFFWYCSALYLLVLAYTAFEIVEGIEGSIKRKRLFKEASGS